MWGWIRVGDISVNSCSTYINTSGYTWVHIEILTDVDTYTNILVYTRIFLFSVSKEGLDTMTPQ